MNESAFKRLRWEVKKNEVERKVEAFRKEHIEKKKTIQVWLIKAIYVELFASHTPIAKEIWVLNKKREVGTWKRN
jgi:hypothetical protein